MKKHHKILLCITFVSFLTFILSCSKEKIIENFATTNKTEKKFRNASEKQAITNWLQDYSQELSGRDRKTLELVENN